MGMPSVRFVCKKHHSRVLHARPRDTARKYPLLSGLPVGCHCSSFRKRCRDADWRNHQRACKIHQKLNEINTRIAMTPPKRPPVGQCTGCKAKERDVRRLALCKECGYQACSSCESHYSRGASHT